jgi:hypothetical protein
LVVGGARVVDNKWLGGGCNSGVTLKPPILVGGVSRTVEGLEWWG